MATETPSKLDGWGAVRLVLCTVGGVMAGNSAGAITEGEVTGLVGAAISMASIAWGIYVRWNARSVPIEVAIKPDIPVQSSLTGQVTVGPGVPK
jgi:hypothetical protein